MIGNLIKLGGYLLLAREAADLITATQQLQEREMQKRSLKHAVAGSLVGVTVGIGIGILYAPRSGKETRAMISDSFSEQMQNLQDNLDERKKQFNEIINTGREKLCGEPAGTEEKDEG